MNVKELIKLNNVFNFKAKGTEETIFEPNFTLGIVRAYLKQVSCNPGKQNSKMSFSGSGLLEPCLDVEGMEFSSTETRSEDNYRKNIKYENNSRIFLKIFLKIYFQINFITTIFDHTSHVLRIIRYWYFLFFSFSL